MCMIKEGIPAKDPDEEELHELLQEFFNYKGVVFSQRILKVISRNLKQRDEVKELCKGKLNYGEPITAREILKVLTDD